MLGQYRNPKVAMVAGKVELAYETEPPPWLQQFRGILSALDRGESPHPLPLFSSPVGCNMSVQKDVLFKVGGFTPDGFGDPRLLPFAVMGNAALPGRCSKPDGSSGMNLEPGFGTGCPPAE